MPAVGLRSAQPSIELQQHLHFSDGPLEALFQAHLADSTRNDEILMLAINLLIFTGMAIHLPSPSGNRPQQPQQLLLWSSLVPHAARLYFMLRHWPLYRRHHVAVAGTAQFVSNIAGMWTLHSVVQGTLLPQLDRAALMHMLKCMPLVGVFYICAQTLFSALPYIVRFTLSTQALIFVLSYLPTSCGHLVSDQLPSTWLPSAELARLGLSQPGCQRVFLALLAAAYCGSLWMAYWREVNKRKAFAQAQGVALSTAWLDALSPLFFALPALLQILSLWSWC